MGGLPADSAVIVSNVSTAKAAADMLLGGRPLTERIVTVTGAVKNPGNFLVPVGTSAKELIQLCGGVARFRKPRDRRRTHDRSLCGKQLEWRDRAFPCYKKYFRNPDSSGTGL